MTPSERVANLGEPNISSIMKLAQLIIRVWTKAGLEAEGIEGMKKEAVGFVVFQQVLTILTESELVELGKILLQDSVENPIELTIADIKLIWLTEAFAIWVEKVDLAAVLKNVSRAATAFKTGPVAQ